MEPEGGVSTQSCRNLECFRCLVSYVTLLRQCEEDVLHLSTHEAPLRFYFELLWWLSVVHFLSRDNLVSPDVLTKRLKSHFFQSFSRCFDVECLRKIKELKVPLCVEDI